ncbi:MAG: GreA/GreB family elongation factor [Thermoleophilia bacterium]|nr:GreA/GreB family elongation factor [Thermoleophilia bacterium]
MGEILGTREGLAKVRAELERLYGERDLLVERIARTLEEGGMAIENGEYLDSRQERELLDHRIALLEQRLRDARLVEPEPDGELDVGERVRVRDLGSGETTAYRIVGTGEGNPAAGEISHDSPIGAALVGRHVGDVVEVATPGGEIVRLEVLAVDDRT